MRHMQFIKTILLILVVLHLTVDNHVIAQLENDQDISKRGTTAAQFLKISTGGRGTAMGNALSLIHI